MCSDLTNKNNSAVGYRMQKFYNVLEEYTENATQLYIIVCALFQVKFCNINAYALEVMVFQNSLVVSKAFKTCFHLIKTCP